MHAGRTFDDPADRAPELADPLRCDCRKEPTGRLGVEGEGLEKSLHYAAANPLLKTAMTGLIRRIAVRNIGPRSTSPQHPQNSV